MGGPRSIGMPLSLLKTEMRHYRSMRALLNSYTIIFFFSDHRKSLRLCKRNAVPAIKLSEALVLCSGTTVRVRPMLQTCSALAVLRTPASNQLTRISIS
jgi:hypothetical protein